MSGAYRTIASSFLSDRVDSFMRIVMILGGLLAVLILVIALARYRRRR